MEKTVNIDFIFRGIFKIAISMDTAAVKEYTTELQLIAYKQGTTGQNELHYFCGQHNCIDGLFIKFIDDKILGGLGNTQDGTTSF